MSTLGAAGRAPMTRPSRPRPGPGLSIRRPVSLPLARRLAPIAGFLVLIVGCLVLLAGLGLETLSAVRAYVGGESLWSKAQKEAVHHLTRYALSGAEGDDQAYLRALAVPLGDRQARLELEKPDPDLRVVYEGFRAGGNHPEDLEGMANLFRRFRRVPQMARAIAVWAEGDAGIARLRELGEALHGAIQSGGAAPERIRGILGEVDALDQRLSRLETEFSGTLADGARLAKRVVLGTIVLAAVLLLGAGVAVSGRVLRQAEESAERYRAEERRLAFIYDSVLDPVFLLSIEPGECYRFLSVNNAFLVVTGLGREQVVGRRIEEVLPESSRALAIGKYGEAIRGNKTVRWEEVAVYPAGERVGEVIVSPIVDETGRVSQLIGLVHDVTERARREREAERQRREADVVADLAQTINAALDLDTTLQRVTEAARELCGSDLAQIGLREAGSETMVGRYWVGARGPDYQTVQIEPGRGVGGQVLATGRPFRTAHYANDPRISKDYLAMIEAEGIVTALAVPIRIEDRIEGLLLVDNRSACPFTDHDEAVLARLAGHAATAIHNAELLEGLRRHQAQLEALLDLSRELSRIQPMESLLGRIAEACGKFLATDSAGFRLLEGDDLVVTGTWGDAREAMSTPRIKVGESLSGAVASSGEPLIVPDIASDPRLLPAHQEADRRLGHRAWMGIPVKAGERVLGVLSIRTRRPQGFSAENLTMATAFASQAATALENARLYAQAQQAYAELSRTQAQLSQAQKVEAVGQLAGGVAHDFNNLLTVITGRSQLLLRRLDPDDPLRRHAKLIDQTAERAAALTQQLLAFSRKQVLQPKVLDLNAVVTGMGKMLRRLIGENIELVIRLGSDLGSVEADPGQLEQVILNLAVNARDAMPRGGRLTLETERVELDPAFVRRHPGAQPGLHVALVVRDTGIGMDADTQAHLFEPFFTTKGPGKGTGLGLATVYGIVKQSGGYIAVESEPGRGTGFTIYLPRIERAAEAVTPGPAGAGTPHGSETILLVEDEEGVRDLTREILETSGYRVLEARHGAEALRVGEQHPGPVHLLVSDVVMPQMDGRELADRLRALRPDLRVLFMSGYTADALGHHSALDPGTNLLPKPFSPDALARRVREVLDAPLDAPPR